MQEDMAASQPECSPDLQQDSISDSMPQPPKDSIPDSMPQPPEEEAEPRDPQEVRNSEQGQESGAAKQAKSEEMLDRVQTCLEELLSKNNLQEDTFIQQHMNGQMYIPLCILAGHRKIGRLGPGIDVEALLEAAGRSDKIGVDEEQLLVKPLLKPKRNTLILHDLPEDVTEEELSKLFEALPDKDSFCSVKPDVNRTAYATFRDDEAAQSAALWLRDQKLRDSSVKCNVKAEHFLRSFFPATHGGMMQYGMQGQVMWSMPGWWSTVGAVPYDGSLDSGWGDGGCGDAGGWMSGAEGVADGGMSMFQDPNTTPRMKGCKGKCFKGKGRRKGVGPLGFETDMGPMEAQRSVAERRSPSLQARLSPRAAFPPVTQEQVQAPADVDVVDDDSLGYAYEFRKYSRQQIVEVCNAMNEVIRPESYARFENEEQDVKLFRQIPHKDWAPVPTPQISFAPSVFAANSERRRSASVDMPGSPAVDGFPGSRTRKASWSRGLGRSRSPSRGRLPSAQTDEWGGDGSAWEAGDWDDWGDERPWAGEPPVGGSRLRRSSARQRSSWSDRPGPQWVERSKVREASQARESSQTRHQGEGTETKEAWAPGKPMSWVEKVRVAAEASGGIGGAPQRWEAKKSTRAADDGKREKAETAESDVAKEPAEASASAADAAQDTGRGEPSEEAPPCSEATEAIAEKATTAAQEQKTQTWAQRVVSPKSQDQPQHAQQQQPQQQPQQQQQQSTEPNRAADEAAVAPQPAAAVASPKRGRVSEGDEGSKPSEASTSTTKEPRIQTWADRVRKGSSK